MQKKEEGRKWPRNPPASFFCNGNGCLLRIPSGYGNHTKSKEQTNKQKIKQKKKKTKTLQTN